MIDTTKEDLRAANEAIGAAVRVRGEAMQVWDLVGAIVALWQTSIHDADAAEMGHAIDVAAGRLVGLAVMLVGRRRAMEKVELYAKNGADRNIS